MWAIPLQAQRKTLSASEKRNTLSFQAVEDFSACKKNFKKIAERGAVVSLHRKGGEPMSFQNPVFIPGPTNIPEEIRKACDMPTIDHRSPTFARMFKPAVAGVRRVLRMDEGEVIILPSTGTGGWEAAISNTLSAGDTVLAARFGMFSHRWIDMCQRHGLDVQVIEAPWGQGAPVARSRAALRADTDHQIKAVLATHNETATGVKSDIAGIRRCAGPAGHPALLLVDGVSSIGSMPFDMAGWGVDIAVAGSQKGFMLPVGLAILGVSPKRSRRWRRRRCRAPSSTSATCCAAMRRQLSLHACRRADRRAGESHRGAGGRGAGQRLCPPSPSGRRRAPRHCAWGMRPCAASPDLYSDTVTAVVVPEGATEPIW
jgi:alanine-glyoxylate transaminase / serine-glyoxylate transaminase / serine-pyruvate transaminase